MTPDVPELDLEHVDLSGLDEAKRASRIAHLVMCAEAGASAGFDMGRVAEETGYRYSWRQARAEARQRVRDHFRPT